MSAVIQDSLTPSGFAFTGNPIFYKTGAGGILHIAIDGKVYQAKMLDPKGINLADIADAHTTHIIDALAGYPYEWLIEVEDMSFIGERMCTISNNDNDDVASFVAMKGRVPVSTLQAIPAGDDIFTRRFLKGGNMFLTVRPGRNILSIKETELYPLYFIQTEEGRIEVYTPDGEYRDEQELLPGIYAINLDTVRRKFFEDFGVLPSVLKIERDTYSPCTVVIESARPTQSRLWLRFRNSLGVFEKIELTGKPMLKRDFQGAESEYMEYRPKYDDFVARFPRKTESRSISVTSGFKSDTEFNLLAEAIASEEVYLSGCYDREIRVALSAEDFTEEMRPAKPNEITVNITLEDAENILFSTSKSGIFSIVFNDVFN